MRLRSAGQITHGKVRSARFGAVKVRIRVMVAPRQMEAACRGGADVDRRDDAHHSHPVTSGPSGSGTPTRSGGRRRTCPPTRRGIRARPQPVCRDVRERTPEQPFASGEEAVREVEEREVMPMEGARHRLVRKE